MDACHALAELLPSPLRENLFSVPDAQAAQIREIRVRVAQPALLCSSALYGLGEGGVVPRMEGWRPSPADMNRILDQICGHAVYAYEESLRQGYLVMPGGFRVGMAGTMECQEGRPLRQREISAFCFRIPRAFPGMTRPALPYLTQSGRFCSTLVLSRPGLGKTSFLRDLSCQLSPLRAVSIVDERSEIAACFHGQPQMDVGCADVLSGCPKPEAVAMLLRAMAPEILITDEIGRPGDAEALLDAAAGGVSVLASAHAASVEEAKSRPLLQSLFQAGLFHRFVLLAGRPGRISGVWDEAGDRLGP